MKTQKITHFSLFAHLTLVALVFSGACKSLDPTLNPASVPVPTAFSRVNVPVEIPVETLGNLLNQRIPPVLFEEKGMDLGNGVIGDLNFSRNGLTKIEGLGNEKFRVELPIRVRGEVGLKPGGLRNLFQSKIPLDESFSPIFLINPEINENWSVGISDFELVDLGGKMSFNVLGMELDLSQMITREIQDFASKNLISNPDLIKLKPLVDQLWNEVGKPVFVEFQGKKMAFSIQPDSLKISESFTPEGNYQINLGMKGKVNSHPAAAAPSRPFPLPKLTPNDKADNSLDIRIPLSLTYVEIDELLRENFANQAIRVNKTTVFRPSNFKSRSYGEKIGISMDFHAEQENGKAIDGELFLVGLPAFDSENQVLIFEQVNFNLKSNSPKAKTAAALKKGKIIRQLNQKLRFPLAEVMEGSLGGINERLALETPIADLKVLGLEIYPAGFYPTLTGLEIQLKATGKVDVSWK
ncbi:DUF4403 family protein [Algoriphagus sp.]|uniref:DUF4403 family protein n=1 Tax=Algoriphagus sp. TaxID=1872435 RepID=UPI00391A7262